MDYMWGASLFFIAATVIAVGRLILNRPGARTDNEAFGAGEAIAFVFTGLVAFGTALISAKAIDDWSLEGLVLMSIALAVAGVASVAMWILLARLTSRARYGAGSGAPSEPTSPDRGRRGRPTGATVEGKQAKLGKRAA